MSIYRTLFGIAMLLALPMQLGWAAEIENREQALQALKSPDAQARRDGAAGLAKYGEMADADILLEELYDGDPQVREVSEAAVWQVWMRSGDDRVDSLLKSGIRRMNDGQMAPAVEDFTRVIELRPDFAEGWNKRATAYYLMGDYDQSLKDCDEVVKRNPHHFGALSGYGLIYVQRGELERALEYFERALDVNPNMPGVEQSIEMIRYRLKKSGKEST